MIRIFDLINGSVVPTEHCYLLDDLKVIMKLYPEDYIKVYSYIFYMTCPSPDLNPFFNVSNNDKEELIISSIGGIDFNTEDEEIQKAIEFCHKLYETPTLRAYNGISTMLDNFANYMSLTPITDGRDGNLTQLISAAKNFKAVRETFKDAYKDLEEEQQSRNKGGRKSAYDQ